MEAKIPQAADHGQVDEFLNTNLRANVKWALKDEYPLAFAESNRTNSRIITEGQDILAHAIMKPNLVKTPYHIFKVGLIGSVVTDEKHRGKGYSKAIIKSCIEAAEQQDCDFSILWTDLFNFYSQFGYEVAGSEIALQTNKNFKASIKDSINILETTKVASTAILKLYNKHSLQTLRQAQDITQFLKIPNTKLLTAWNKVTNALEAYITIGKGADFTNYIHEWGGSVSSIMSLVQYQQQRQEDPLTLITPPQCTNLIKQFQEQGAETFYGILGMIRITKPIGFCKKIKKGARSLGYSDLIFEYRDGIYYFGYKDEVYQTDSAQDIIRLCFGPNKPEQIHSFSEQTLEAFKEIFPIPFWIWGWDSI